MTKIEQAKTSEHPDNHVQAAIERKAKDLVPDGSHVNKAKEIGGPKGLEPTRYGDWEAKGRCYDF